MLMWWAWLGVSVGRGGGGRLSVVQCECGIVGVSCVGGLVSAVAGMW